METTTPLSKRADEDTTSFWMRAAAHEVWVKAHTDICERGAACEHTSPYRDDA